VVHALNQRRPSDDEPPGDAPMPSMSIARAKSLSE
jgi:hypothetical protein